MSKDALNRSEVIIKTFIMLKQKNTIMNCIIVNCLLLTTLIYISTAWLM